MSSSGMFLQKTNKIFHLFLFRDASGANNWYQAISVIEHKGLISKSKISAGHYICDIKEKNSGKWFRTNDDSFPAEIGIGDVSRQGYAILFKRNNN